jgi:hypothetical protein
MSIAGNAAEQLELARPVFHCKRWSPDQAGAWVRGRRHMQGRASLARRFRRTRRRRGSPCRSLQCRHLLPAPSLGSHCRNSLSYNDFLPEIGPALTAFWRISLQIRILQGGDKVRPCAVPKQNVGLRTCRLGLQAARPSERRPRRHTVRR